MKHYNQEDLQNLEKLFRGNLINSCTGYKSANLIGTRSKNGVENVAIFNSVNHLGSNPPILSILFRPTTVLRNTYDNIKRYWLFYRKSYHKGYYCTSSSYLS